MSQISRRFRRARRRARWVWPYYLPAFRRPIRGERFFCQNSGGCGSTYLIHLLESNAIEGCYHEKEPDLALDVLGIRHYEGVASERRLKSLLLYSRRDVFFEANNRLFSMTPLLRECFPDARFIHLHRDPRELIPSGLARPVELTYESGRPRYTSEKLCGPRQASVLERSCRYWANYNQRIADDLGGLPHLSLKFRDLVEGRVEELEAFVGLSLSEKKIPPVNVQRGVRQGDVYPAFDDWNPEDRETLHQICGPIMRTLGYSL